MSGPEAPPSTAPSDDRAQRAGAGPPPASDTAEISGRLAEGRARTRLSRFARWALVVPLLVLWLVGWITPIVPGFPFLLVALFLMSPDLPAARRLATKLQRRFPRLRRTIPKRWRVTKDRDP